MKYVILSMAMMLSGCATLFPNIPVETDAVTEVKVSEDGGLYLKVAYGENHILASFDKDRILDSIAYVDMDTKRLVDPYYPSKKELLDKGVHKGIAFETYFDKDENITKSYYLPVTFQRTTKSDRNGEYEHNAIGWVLGVEENLYKLIVRHRKVTELIIKEGGSVKRILFEKETRPSLMDDALMNQHPRR